MPFIFNAIENLIKDIPDSQAIAVVDLSWGLSIAEKRLPSSEITIEYLTVLSALVTDIFTSSLMNQAEKYVSQNSGRPVFNSLSECQFTTPVGYHLIVKVPNKNYALVAVINHSSNLNTAWSSVRAGAVKLQALL